LPLGGILAACGGGTTAQIGSTQALLAPGYLATSPQAVDFIQWTRQGGSFSGSFSAVYANGTPPNETTQPRQGTASGSIDGSRVSVNVSGPAPDFGNLSNGTLIINFPQRDGTLMATTFRPGTADDYNRAVLALRDQAASANAAEIQQEQAAAR